MTAGCVVQAAKADAFATAFCISTDATGIGIQPEPQEGKSGQPCRRGHFFVMVADRDHVLFEYVPRETSAAVRELCRGYAGYVQADAKNTYDVLFDKPGPSLGGTRRTSATRSAALPTPGGASTKPRSARTSSPASGCGGSTRSSSSTPATLQHEQAKT